MSCIKLVFYLTGGMITQKFGRRKPIIIGTFILAIILTILGTSSYLNSYVLTKESKKYNLNVGVSISFIYFYFIAFFNGLGAIVPIYNPEIVSD